MQRFEESPMLEIAHERQFVVSQMGGCSAGFDKEHTRRVMECLSWLDIYFHSFVSNELCWPVSPNPELGNCWMPEISLDTLPPLLLLSHDSCDSSDSSCTASDDITPLVDAGAVKDWKCHSESSPAQQGRRAKGPKEVEQRIKQAALIRPLPKPHTTLSSNAVCSQRLLWRPRPKSSSRCDTI